MKTKIHDDQVRGSRRSKKKDDQHFITNPPSPVQAFRIASIPSPSSEMAEIGYPSPAHPDLEVLFESPPRAIPRHIIPRHIITVPAGTRVCSSSISCMYMPSPSKWKRSNCLKDPVNWQDLVLGHRT